jgi:membrane associated rhomboid family serine protease
VIPIGDSIRTGTTPYVNYLLILANIGVFLYALTLSTEESAVPGQRRFDREQLSTGACYGLPTTATEVDRFYCEWALQPRELLDALEGETDLGGQGVLRVVATLVTSMFLHAGWLHIIGNMLFLWVFGDNVEDRLGHIGYIVFYFLAGAAASGAQIAIDTESLIPIVGASGAVAGVLGAYFVWHPGATVTVIVPFFPFVFIPLPIPAVLMIGFWFAQNLLAGYASLGNVAAPDGGVAFFAHIGGFVLGMVVAIFIGGRKQRPAPKYG